MQNNLFIVPVNNEYGEIAGYFPALPSTCELVQHGAIPYLKYKFIGGQTRSVRLERCGIVTKHQLKDDIFGEPNTALGPTMELTNIVNQGIAEGVKNASTYRFMAQLNTKTFDEDLRKARKRFDENNFQDGDGGGLLLFGSQMTNIKELSSRNIPVDPEQMKIIRENVCNYFGVGEKVIRNEATGDELDAFFNGSIEPFAIKLSDAMTNMTFSERERNNGNAITPRTRIQ